MDIKEQLKAFAALNDVPILMEDSLAFLLDYIEGHEVRHILEIGTAIGFSAIMMARSDERITVDTLEIDPERFAIAQRNIESFGLSDRVHAYCIDAIAFTPSGDYDLIFVDAAKSWYERHRVHFEPYLAPGGAFIFDNIEFHGMVDHPERTHNRHTKDLIRKLGQFRAAMLGSTAYDVTYHKRLGDGILVAKRRETGDARTHSDC